MIHRCRYDLSRQQMMFRLSFNTGFIGTQCLIINIRLIMTVLRDVQALHVLIVLFHSFLIQLQLDDYILLIANVRLGGIGPLVCVELHMLVLLGVMVDNKVLETVWEVIG